MSAGDQERIFFHYRFRFEGDIEATFVLNLDYDSLALVHDQPPTPPWWAKLTLNQCPNCSLDPNIVAFCPVAVNLSEPIHFLRELPSYEKVDVKVKARRRAYVVTTTLQSAYSSMMGIVMVTSGCPVLDKLRPMVETHEPLYDWLETTYKACSMYLMAQYFRSKNGMEPEWDFKGLARCYEEVQTVNFSFAKRLREVQAIEGDAVFNAIGIWDTLGTVVQEVIEWQDLVHWERIFMAHWGDNDK